MKRHLCHVFPAFGHGGPEVRTALIINSTADEFQHTVISISGESSGWLRVHANGSARLKTAPAATSWGGYPRVLARMLRDVRPDLVLTYGWGGVDAILASRLSGLRRIIHEEDGFLPDEAHRQKWRRLWARRVLLRAATLVVVPSQTLVSIGERAWRLPRRLVHYLPNGVDVTRFSRGTAAERAAARARFGYTDRDVVIGTVGHLRSEKNHERLIGAFAQLPVGVNRRLLVVGDGELRQTLERRARDLGVADLVTFTGVLADPIDCYRAMDLFALSSDTEQMPIAVLEAMSTGLPVVSTAVGDVRQMVSGENQQYVTPLGDDPAYSAALAGLAQRGDERTRLGQLNHARCVDRYDIKTMIEAYRDLYSQVIGT